MSLNDQDSLIKEWLEEIKEYLHEQKDSSLDVQEKTSDNDLVTIMDKRIEERLVNKIREKFPDDKIVGEEGYGDDVQDLEGTVWFIDPIDGTLNFVMQRENFAVMIAVYTDGVGQLGYIYDVTQDKLYSTIKGDGVRCNGQQLEKPADLKLSEGLIASSSALMVKSKHESVRKIGAKSLGVRMLGSAGLESIEVAKGNVSAYVASNLKPWDIAPGLLFMEELGMKGTQFTNQKINILENNNIVFATKNAHKDIINLLSE